MCGKWLRIANARSAIASGEYREPMMRIASRALAGLQQLAPRDERAEDRVRDRGFELISRRNSSGEIASTRPARRHARVEVRALPGQHVQLAEEPARGRGSRRCTSPSRSARYDLDLALEDHEEVVRRRARAVEDVAGLDIALDTERCELRELGRAEGGTGDTREVGADDRSGGGVLEFHGGDSVGNPRDRRVPPPVAPVAPVGSARWSLALSSVSSSSRWAWCGSSRGPARVGGSFMSGEAIWAVIGVVVGLVGVALLVGAARARAPAGR